MTIVSLFGAKKDAEPKKKRISTPKAVTIRFGEIWSMRISGNTSCLIKDPGLMRNEETS